MRITTAILVLNLLLIGCATNNAPIEDNYMGSKTNFEDNILIKDSSMAIVKALVVESLNRNNFQITLNDNKQNVLVAKKKVGLEDSFATTSIYLFNTSNGVSIRVISNFPKGYAKSFDLHSKLLKELSQN